MKVLFLLATLAAGMLACNSERCYQCETKISYSQSRCAPGLTSASSISTVCDLTKDEADAYESAGTTTTTTTVSGCTVTQYSVTTCK